LAEGFKKAKEASPVKALEFAFEDLTLTIPEKLCHQHGGKTILSGVTGKISPGKVTAIMGPSGAGKTTMMTVLMGKNDPRFDRSGSLAINGRAISMELFKQHVGYVPQEDVMLRELTVRDNVKHAAKCRLPSGWTGSDRKLHVEAVLQALDLMHVCDTPVGDENMRGVSGGQRKR
jgi:ABC-type multidrug transport system ATPase subunit